MVLKNDGTKWACQSCLKGHRVSGCNHTDRELTLVPKKGRPITQCQHCRLERKKRSAHVSCDCGEADKPQQHSKAKCIHLREAEGKAKAGSHGEQAADDPEKDTAHLTIVAEEQGCCCHHGGKCTCCLPKKESGDEETSVKLPRGPAVKPRLGSTRSDGSITVFQNGHHKPVHRKSHLAHESGMPYKLPMTRAHTDQNVSKQARRSVDSLALNHDTTVNLAPLTPRPGALLNVDRRVSKSEQHSPRMTNSDAFGNAQLSPIDFSKLGSFETGQNTQSTNSDNSYNAPLDPMSGMTDNSFDPWSNFPSSSSMALPNNNPFGVWPSNNDSMGSLAQPALTAASSNTQSEIDELPPTDDMYGFGMPSIQEDNTGGNLTNGAMSSTSPQSHRRSLPPSFFSDYDAMGPSTMSEWQPIPHAAQYGADETLSKSNANTQQAMAYDDTWQMGTYTPLADDLTRQTSGLANIGRLGSPSAAGICHDLMVQMFPNVQTNGGFFDSINHAQNFTNGTQRMYCHDATSAPMTYDPTTFTSQAWTDGSLHDAFTSSYNMDHSFSGTDYTGDWSR